MLVLVLAKIQFIVVGLVVMAMNNLVVTDQSVSVLVNGVSLRRVEEIEGEVDPVPQDVVACGRSQIAR